jgi:hypothetical protein
MTTATQVAVDMVNLADRVADEGYAIVVLHGAMLQAHAKRHANQPRTAIRPRDPADVQGPRFLEGNLNRSINMRPTRLPGAAMVEVGSNAPQARRLELGFMNMTDSLGREFHQVPYPFLGPALAEVEPLFVAALARAGLPHLRTAR